MTDEATTSEVGKDDTEPTVATTAEATKYIVGEHSVYNSVDDLLRGAREKEAYIQKLLGDMKAVKEENESLKQDKSLKETLLNIRKGNTMTEEALTPAENTNPQFTDDAIKQIALKAMAEANAAQTAAKNLKECKDLVASKAGDADIAIKNKAEELGVTEQDLTDMAANKPQLFKKLFDITAPVNGASFITNGVRTEAQPTTAGTNKFEELIKTPNKCYDQNFMASLITEALKNPNILGDSEWKIK